VANSQDHGRGLFSFMLHGISQTSPQKLDLLGIRPGMTMIEFMSIMKSRGVRGIDLNSGATCRSLPHPMNDQTVRQIDCRTLSVTTTECIGKWLPQKGPQYPAVEDNSLHYDPSDPPIVASVQITFLTAIPYEEVVASVSKQFGVEVTAWPNEHSAAWELADDMVLALNGLLGGVPPAHYNLLLLSNKIYD
jgi:hypothetical protein